MRDGYRNLMKHHTTSLLAARTVFLGATRSR